MKKLLGIFCLAVSYIFLATPVRASSDRAYQDYLYQADQYRQKYNEFSITKNEYLKFKTLASETSAIARTKQMLSQRSQLLRAYLLLLQEKINETSTMNESDRELYRTLIKNEVAFLENHSTFIESIATIPDATKASEQLEGHYSVLAIAIRQIIIGLNVARMTAIGNTYSETMVKAQQLLNTAKKELPLDRQEILDRWFLKISDKRTLYLQKIDSVNQAKIGLKGGKIEAIDLSFQQAQSQMTQGKQELTEGTAYIRELINAMKFKN